MESVLFVLCLIMLAYRCRQSIKCDEIKENEDNKRQHEQREKR